MRTLLFWMVMLRYRLPRVFAGIRETSQDSVNVRAIPLMFAISVSVRGSPRAFAGFRSRVSVSVRVRLGSFLSVR